MGCATSRNIQHYKGNTVYGIANGYGEEYYESGVLKYKGNFRDGYYNGTGELYYVNGQIKYSGIFLKGKYHKSGKLYKINGFIVYDGQWKNGQITYGTIYKFNRKIVTGFFVNRPCTHTLCDLLIHVSPEKMCKVYTRSGHLLFEGNMKNGNCCGCGSFYLQNGTRYEGRITNFNILGIINESENYIENVLSNEADLTKHKIDEVPPVLIDISDELVPFDNL